MHLLFIIIIILILALFLSFWLQGRFTIAAKHHISIAEIYETELVDIDKVKLNICVLIVHVTFCWLWTILQWLKQIFWTLNNFLLIKDPQNQTVIRISNKQYKTDTKTWQP